MGRATKQRQIGRRGGGLGELAGGTELVDELRLGPGVALLVDDLAGSELDVEVTTPGGAELVALDVVKRNDVRGAGGDVSFREEDESAIGEDGNIVRGIDGDVDDELTEFKGMARDDGLKDPAGFLDVAVDEGLLGEAVGFSRRSGDAVVRSPGLPGVDQMARTAGSPRASLFWDWSLTTLPAFMSPLVSKPYQTRHRKTKTPAEMGTPKKTIWSPSA